VGETLEGLGVGRYESVSTTLRSELARAIRSRNAAAMAVLRSALGALAAASPEDTDQSMAREVAARSAAADHLDATARDLEAATARYQARYLSRLVFGTADPPA